MWRACLCVIVLFEVIVAAERPEPRVTAANLTTGCVERFDATADYFPDKVAIEDAANFSVEYRRSYKVVTVKQSYAGGSAEHYVLVQCGAPVPHLTGELARAQVVTVPIASLGVLSPTHLSLLADLARLDVLTGVAQLEAVTSPELQARISAGRVAEFAKASRVIDVERVVSAKPSLLMSGGTSNTAFPVIRNAGIPVVANTEWLEPTALGRAEWLKYMALFLNEEREAQTLFGSMKSRYRSLSTLAGLNPHRPLVMTGRSTRGMFTIAGGRSYVAGLINDAGGHYAWADNTAVGNASVDLEAQIQRAANADFWINGGGWKSLAAMLEDEPRYTAFKAYRQGQVWVYERRETPNGANDYWSRSVTHPDIVLADLVKILHPELVPDHAFEWYMRVPAR